MEDELFTQVYRLLVEEGNKRLRRGRTQYSDVLILLVYFWAVIHDRPTCWACQRRNWPAAWQWLSLPSQPTMSRRLRSLSVGLLLMAVMDRLRAVHRPQTTADPLVHVLDSRPLVVGGSSKDRDAQYGHAICGMARGYKSFDLYGTAVVPDQLQLGTLKWSDLEGGMRLLRQADFGGYLLADSSFDSSELHAWARGHGIQMVAPRRLPGTGLGHRPHDPARLRSIELLEGPDPFGSGLFAMRNDIERHYGNCSSFACGLQPLPSWVRTPPRVARWLWAKHILNGLRICITKRLAA